MPAPSPAPLDPERLLTEDPFVRGLARQLLRDTHAADDLVQQTWVAALQAAPPAGGLRHWLAVVVRRLAGRRARSERHRDERQRRAARADATP
jgi:DNA-directed RNA polymerase specialized sigma24 family protein